jgi:undecaprenyl-diphosphatase
MGALMLGVERRAATEFSFFLAIPTMFGAAAYDLYKNRADITSHDGLLILVGLVVSFVSALLVVRWLVGFVGRHGFTPFAWYRIAVGALAAALMA